MKEATNTTVIVFIVLVSLIVGALIPFVGGYAIIGALGALVLILLILKEPIIGLYAYLLISYLRPQDLIPAIGIVSPNLAVLGITLVAGLVHKKYSGAPRLAFRPPDKWYLLFLAAAIASNATSIWPSNSLDATIELLKLAPFYYCIRLLLNTREKFERFLRLLVYSLLFVAAVQIYTYATVGFTLNTGRGGYGLILPGIQLGGDGPGRPDNFDVHGVGGYSYSFLANTSELGLAVVMYLPLCFYLFMVDEGRWRLRFLVGTFVLLLSVVVSGSRGAFVGFVFSFMVFMRKQKKLLVGALLLLAVVVPMFMLSSGAYTERIASIQDVQNDESINIRLNLWTASLSMIMRNPLLGMGVENFAVAYGNWYSHRSSGGALYWSPHNILVQVATETGLPGLFCYIMIFVSCWRLNRETRDITENCDLANRYRALTNALDLALVGYLISGLFITATYYPHLFQLAALTSAFRSIAESEVGETAPATAQTLDAGGAVGRIAEA